ncbi:MAG: cation:proton antiporter [Bacilli bacterium]|nr:cation:proton antiporter [Bacilli bacterium]
MKIIKLPNVTGYLLTGILIGPFVLGLAFNGGNFAPTGPIYEFIHTNLAWISEIALGFIAFTIGSSFKLSALKAVGKKVIVITVLEALGASLFITVALIGCHFIFPSFLTFDMALTLGAIAAATAPAATLMVIKQYNARGPLVQTLLPVVALDDAAALILFAILFSAAKTMATGSSFDVYNGLVKPIIEILVSLGFGAVSGLLISLGCKLFKSRANRTILAMFAIFLCVGLYHLFELPELGGFELSSLLMCMMSGAIFINLRGDALKTFDRIDKFTPPVFMLFFVISGANLDLTVFASSNAFYIIITALIYCVIRALGKWVGAYSGARITRAEPVVQKYLGFALIPQAGVAIGLATTAGKVLTAAGSISGTYILAIVLTTTMIYEIIGPAITKMALQKAGEIRVESTPVNA